MKHQALGGVLDWWWQASVAQRLPHDRKGPVIDMDGDRYAGLDIDADQADDETKINDAVDAYP